MLVSVHLICTLQWKFLFHEKAKFCDKQIRVYEICETVQSKFNVKVTAGS